MIREGIQKLVNGSDLSPIEAHQIMNEVMTGKATNAQTAAFITALRIKGESVEEITTFASVMKENCIKIHPKVQGRLVDTCGTGGDKIRTFNVSTITAFVIAGAGIPVAKHGNRAVSSNSGSADVLEKLGLNLNMTPQVVEHAIETVGVGFMFAPIFHPAMKYAAEPRREIGIRTIFNMLGPLTNPASANAQLMGVYDPKMVSQIATALGKLGMQEAMVVHGLSGLEEISTVGATSIAHLKDGQVVEKIVSASTFGVKKAKVTDLQLSNPEDNTKIIHQILTGTLKDAKADFVLVNSAAGIVIGGLAETFTEGIELARESIQSGAAYAKLEGLVKASGGDLGKLEELKSDE
ncbi:MAG: anthranilate phosphoribosyltransferase [Candidatus Bathyarchaeota archaeon]|nr:anthranilate phosphoribosyltransferase [Candidatus Bathyarchaeota archaeon]